MNQTDAELISKINDAANTTRIAMITQLELFKERKGIFTDGIKRLEEKLKNMKQESVNNDKRIDIMEKKIDEDTHNDVRVEPKYEATSPPYVPECASACAECVGPLERRFACDHFQCLDNLEKCWHCGEKRTRKSLKMEYTPAPKEKYPLFLFLLPH